MSETSLALLGFMGSGKSTVGRGLAHQTGWTWLDLDELIVKKAGCSIPEIFERFGEERFRQWETQLLRESAQSPSRIVLSTGGGVPVRPENWVVLDQNFITVYLRCSYAVCYRRISGDVNRPLLSRHGAQSSLKQLYRQRIPYYERARIIIDVARLKPEQIVQNILERINENTGNQAISDV